MERDPQFYIDKGIIKVDDEAEFRIIIDALRCFGLNYKAVRQAFFPHPAEPNLRIRFPKFYENGEWSNIFSNGEKTITEKCLDPKKAGEKMANILDNRPENRLVFGHMTGFSGKLMYVFKGEFKIDRDKTSPENGLIHHRVATSAATYLQNKSF